MTLYTIEQEDKGNVTIWTMWKEESSAISHSSILVDWFPTYDAAARAQQAFSSS